MKLVYSPKEVDTHRKINLHRSYPRCLETQQALDEFCEEYKVIFYLHPVDVSHTELLTVDIDTRDHLPAVQKPYTPLLKHTQWV